MTRKLLIVELDTVRDQVTDLIKDSFEKALDLIAEDIRTKHGFSSEASIQGLREQITANTSALLSFMKNSSNSTMTLSSRPDVKIVTLGNETKRAVIFVRHTTGFKKFLHSEKVATTSAALSNVLKITEKLLEGHIEGTTCANSKRTNVTARSMSDSATEKANMTTNDLSFWDSTSVNNNSFNDSGDERNDSGFESGDEVADPNASFSSTASTIADDNMYVGVASLRR